MRLPSGYGSVIKHRGNRRRPYQVRITRGWDDNGKQLYSTLGWFEKREEAIIALSEYNSSPYDIEANKETFTDVFKKWKLEHYPKVSDNAIVNYNLAYKYCKAIHKMRFKDIRLTHLQAIIDNCGKGYPTRKVIKALMNQLFNFAIKNFNHDIPDLYLRFRRSPQRGRGYSCRLPRIERVVRRYVRNDVRQRRRRACRPADRQIHTLVRHRCFPVRRRR